jgi:acetylornithine deacetylase/succinyl-diaminopimelate desuccinylase-like protein
MTRKTTKKPSHSTSEISPAKSRLLYFEERRDPMVDTIRRLVEIESPSDNKHAVDRCSAFVAEQFGALGGRAEFHRVADFGNHLQVDFTGETLQKPVLLLGHYDTVYPLGTIASMPCHTGNGRLWGPGVLDMKSGIAMMLHAIEGLQAWNGRLPRPVTVLLVSDEEVGEGVDGSAGAGAIVWAERRREDSAQGRGRILVEGQGSGVAFGAGF